MGKVSKKTIGFLNEGENTQIIDCEFQNCDIGIHNKGKGLIASGNKFFYAIENSKFWKQFWVHIIIGGLLVTVFGGVILYFLIKYIG